MNKDSFKEQVKKGLDKLNHQQQVVFAWRCAVRALFFCYPFKAGQRYLVGWKSASAFHHSLHQSSGTEKMSDNAALIQHPLSRLKCVAPFLGHQGSFDFWKTRSRKSNLYSIFYALDFAATAAYTAANDSLK